MTSKQEDKSRERDPRFRRPPHRKCKENAQGNSKETVQDDIREKFTLEDEDGRLQEECLQEKEMKRNVC